MKKRFLHRVNIVLGALSLTLAGCHSNKAVVQDGAPRPMLKYGIPPEIRAMYGVQVDYNPADFQLPTDTVAAPDTIAAPNPVPAEQPKQDEIIMTKYGIPGAF